MKLVESYLNEVCRFIPQQQCAEIRDELLEAIVGELEGRAQAAGREPNEEDEKQVLAGFGHPLKVASRYQQNKYLIGPDLYPVFLQTLRAVFAIAIVALVVMAFIASLVNDLQMSPSMLLKMLVQTIVWVGAIVVLVFVSLEYSGERLPWYDRWRPESLSKGSLGIIKRGDVITNLISEAFFVLWWNDVVVLQSWLPLLSEDHQLALSAVWAPYFWPLNIVFITLFVMHFYVLIYGVWRRQTLLIELVSNAALLAIIVALVAAGSIIEVSGSLDKSIQAHLQQSASIALTIVGGVAAWEVWQALKLLFRG